MLNWGQENGYILHNLVTIIGCQGWNLNYMANS
jgi:hypothetical protein